MFTRTSRDHKAKTTQAAQARVFVALALGAAFLSPARWAAADLSEDVERLERDWSKRGAKTERLPAAFAEHGQSRIVQLKTNPENDVGPGCITIAFLAAPTIDFSVAPLKEGAPLEILPLPEGHPNVPLEHDSVLSNLGIAVLTRCNEERASLSRLALSMRSPRGAIDTIIARSATSLGDARDVLSDRVTGGIAPRGNPGRPLEPGPIAERVVRADERARVDGAQSFSRISTMATEDGMGQTRLRLTEGCHRIAVMAAVPTTFPHPATDVDAEVRDEENRVLARDRAETPDARLDFCTGDSSRVTVVFGGAAGAVPMMVTDAVWPIPSGIPNHWGARVRGGFALAFRRRNTPAPAGLPGLEALGSSGTTMIPVRIEPGRCYYAAAAVLRGEPRSIRVSATIGGRFVRDDVVERPEGVGVAFCSGSDESVRIDVDARGNNIFWVFGLFPLGGGSP